VGRLGAGFTDEYDKYRYIVGWPTSGIVVAGKFMRYLALSFTLTGFLVVTGFGSSEESIKPRGYAMQGDTAKAKAAYQDFLTLWKDADPDIPIFIAAKAEYATLQ
jgi:hypothetical protein